MVKAKIHRLVSRFLAASLVVGLCVSAAGGKTRWSSLHMVPDADLLKGSEYHVGVDGFFAKKNELEYLTQQAYSLNLGIIEYVNIEAGYSGGFTMGLKARLLGETRRLMPSLAVGVHNLFTHKESNLFGYTGALEPQNEIYLAMSKSIETIKTRLHLGIQSIPEIETERVNPFFAIEKYFGSGLYASFEGYRRFEQIPLSLFVTWRAWKERLEISAGAVDIQSLFFDADNQFELSLRAEENNTFARPGIWLGIRFHGTAGFGKKDGFLTLEDRLSRQQLLLDSLSRKVDSLQAASGAVQSAVQNLDQSLASLVDSGYGRDQLQSILLDKIVTLKNLYTAAPFEPDRVREALNEIVGYREQAVPVLQEFVMDSKLDRYIRMYSVTALGEIGNRAASDILLDIIGQTNDPDLKVEILIALGKMKETRAMYLMEQLANDPNDAVALTAQDVLSRLSDQTGAFISSDAEFRKIEDGAGEENMEARKVVESTPKPNTSGHEQSAETQTPKEAPQKEQITNNEKAPDTNQDRSQASNQDTEQDTGQGTNQGTNQDADTTSIESPDKRQPAAQSGNPDFNKVFADQSDPEKKTEKPEGAPAEIEKEPQ